MSDWQMKWRESASLIIVSQNSQQKDTTECNYNVLMIKPSDQTAFVQNQAKFPGGIFAAGADETIKWLQYFEECGITQPELRQLVLISNERPRILAPQGTGCYDRFFKRSSIWAREISLRITAIRETFQGVGILICRKSDNVKDIITGQTQFLQDFDRATWQKRVHDNPAEFFNLCRELRVIPDLWALYEWSAWASPAIIKKGYETAFFITFLQEQPSQLIELSVVEGCLWHTPAQLLHLNLAGEIWMMHPQYYELSRCLGIKSFEALQTFARQRANKGTTLYMPVVYLCSDIMVSVLPGDDFYVSAPHEATTSVPFKGTAAEFRTRTKRVHRIENFGMTNIMIHLNFMPLDGHLVPKRLTDNERHKL